MCPAASDTLRESAPHFSLASSADHDQADDPTRLSNHLFDPHFRRLDSARPLYRLTCYERGARADDER